MSAFGKILTFLVLIAACVWAYFTANAYATRTNWKLRADALEARLKESETQREREFRDYQSSTAALDRLYKAEKARGDDQAAALNDLLTAGRKVNTEYESLEKLYRESDIKAQKLELNLQAAQAEASGARERLTNLENERVQLVLDREQAIRARNTADSARKQAEDIRDERAKQIEELTRQIGELKLTGGSGASAVQRSVEKEAAPLPGNIRGTVEKDMVGSFVQISIGIDAGLEPGSKLDVYREGGGGKYLGTLVVTNSVYPKQAVAEFRPARPVPLAQLRSDELPKKGDVVGLLSAPPAAPRR